NHLGVKVISRDRGTGYAEAATRGAPDAIQVADRWHLLQNLLEAVEQVLGQHRAALAITAEGAAVTPAPAALPVDRQILRLTHILTMHPSRHGSTIWTTGRWCLHTGYHRHIV